MNIIRKIFSSKLTIAISCTVLAVLCIAGIVSYLTTDDRAKNAIVIGENTIEIVEDFDPPKELEPGVSFNKNVKVTNTGSVDCYVRVMAVFSDSDIGQYCTVDWQTQDAVANPANGYWVHNAGDNYWYYTVPIAEGESTVSLFTTVTLSDAITEAELKDFDIIVYAESYQSDGFATYTDAWINFKSNKPS